MIGRANVGTEVKSKLDMPTGNGTSGAVMITRMREPMSRLNDIRTTSDKHGKRRPGPASQTRNLPLDGWLLAKNGWTQDRLPLEQPKHTKEEKCQSLPSHARREV